jgi:hypothetical protein
MPEQRWFTPGEVKPQNLDFMPRCYECKSPDTLCGRAPMFHLQHKRAVRCTDAWWRAVRLHHWRSIVGEHWHTDHPIIERRTLLLFALTSRRRTPTSSLSVFHCAWIRPTSSR